MVAWRYEISLFELKPISLVRDIIHHSKRNFKTLVSLRSHVIFSIYYIHFEITDDPWNRIGSQQWDLFTNAVRQTKTADWQVNEVNTVVECSNRFPIPKIDF